LRLIGIALPDQTTDLRDPQLTFQISSITLLTNAFHQEQAALPQAQT
jgi:hypothetical protein